MIKKLFSQHLMLRDEEGREDLEIQLMILMERRTLKSQL
jgi:hypothetical protein